MNHTEIISNLSSRDSHKVYLATNEIIQNFHSSSFIRPFIPSLNNIIDWTNGLEMGGLFAPNQRFVDFAIKVIKFHRDNMGCACALYPQFSFDPEKEISRKRVDFISKETIEWDLVYEASCRKCHNRFQIISNLHGHIPYHSWNLIKN